VVEAHEQRRQFKVSQALEQLAVYITEAAAAGPAQ